MLRPETIKHKCCSCGTDMELAAVSFIYIRFAAINGIDESTAELCPSCGAGFMAALHGKGLWNPIEYPHEEDKPMPSIIT